MTEKPSKTALLVARGIAVVYCTPEFKGLVTPDVGEITVSLLRRVSLGNRFLVELAKWRPTRALMYWMQERAVPGLFVHFALRKRFIQDQVEGAIREGYRQVVVLGAGLDTLALRLHRRYSDVFFAEVDHPASQRIKLSLVDGGDLGENLRFCPMGLLGQGLLELLGEQCGFDAAKPTIFVAEGLLMYLPPDVVSSLLREVGGAGRRVVFTAMELNVLREASFRQSAVAAVSWLRRIGEPFRWGVNAADVPPFLAKLGLDMRDAVEERELLTRYLPGRVVKSAEGERLYVAESSRDLTP